MLGENLSQRAESSFDPDLVCNHLHQRTVDAKSYHSDLAGCYVHFALIHVTAQDAGQQ